MKRVSVFLAFVGFLLAGFAGPGLALAEAPVKPLAVVAVSDYDTLLTKGKAIAHLLDKDAEFKMAQQQIDAMTGGRGLIGFDTKRPIGFIYAESDMKMAGWVYVPVTDGDAFIKQTLAATLGPGAQLREDGILVLQQGPEQKQFVKVIPGGWVIGTDKEENLAFAPQQPDRWFAATLGSSYDVGARLVPANVPKMLRDMFTLAFESQIQSEMEQKLGETDIEFKARTTTIKLLAGIINRAVADVSQVQVGVGFDQASSTTRLEARILAAAGSPSADTLNQITRPETRLAPLVIPGAIINGNMALVIPVTDDISELIDTFSTAVRQGIAEGAAQDNDPQGAKVAMGLANRLADVVEATIRTGEVDCAGSAVYKDGKLTIVAARSIAKGGELEKLVKDLISFVRLQEPQIVQQVLKVEGADVDGVSMYLAEIPIDGNGRDEKNARKLFGNTVPVAIGIEEDTIYAALGADAVPAIKKIVAACKQGAPQPARPIETTIYIAPLLELMSKVGEPQEAKNAQAMLDALGSDAKDTHINILAGPSKNGAAVRIDIEGGVLKLAAAAEKLEQQKQVNAWEEIGDSDIDDIEIAPF